MSTENSGWGYTRTQGRPGKFKTHGIKAQCAIYELYAVSSLPRKPTVQKSIYITHSGATLPATVFVQKLTNLS